MRGYLGNQARNRQKGHRNRGGGGPRHGQEGLPVDDQVMEGTEADIISPEELAASRSAMSLTVLKTNIAFLRETSPEELLEEAPPVLDDLQLAVEEAEQLLNRLNRDATAP